MKTQNIKNQNTEIIDLTNICIYHHRNNPYVKSISSYYFFCPYSEFEKLNKLIAELPSTIFAEQFCSETETEPHNLSFENCTETAPLLNFINTTKIAATVTVNF